MKEQKVVIFLESDIEGHLLQERIADALDIAGIQWDFIDSEDAKSDFNDLERYLDEKENYGKYIIIENSDGSSHKFDITNTSFVFNELGEISKFMINVQVVKDA